MSHGDSPLTRVEKKVINDISDYVENFIDTRFPAGLQGDMRTILSECVLDAFYDGARWSEAQAKEEARIIQP